MNILKKLKYFPLVVLLLSCNNQASIDWNKKIESFGKSWESKWEKETEWGNKRTDPSENLLNRMTAHKMDFLNAKYNLQEKIVNAVDDKAILNKLLEKIRYVHIHTKDSFFELAKQTMSIKKMK